MSRATSLSFALIASVVCTDYVTAANPPASLVIDRTPGPNSTEYGSVPSNFCRIGNVVYFSANDGINNRELWRSDGTAAGTKKVCEINPRGSVVGEMNGSDPRDFIEFNGELYFTAYTETEGREVWKSDGTAEGTVMVKDVRPGPLSGILSTGPDFTIYKNQLYFVGAISGETGSLCRTDGTPEGTIAMGLGTDPTKPQFRGITEIESCGGYLFFNPKGAFDYYGLWQTDGTEEGFIKTSPSNYDWYDPQDLTDVNGTLYFNCNNTDDLCKSGTTTGSAELIKSSVYEASGFTSVNGKIVFSALSSSNGLTTVWVTDGTSAGTRHLAPSANLLFPTGFTLIDNQMLFSANGIGSTIWITDGTEAGTRSIPFIDMNVGDGGATVMAQNFTLFNGEIYFLGTYSYRGDTYTSLYKSNGTTEGTRRVRSNVYATDFTVLSNHILFSGTTVAFGAQHELWRTDGSEGGTSQLKNIAAPAGSTFNSASTGIALQNSFYYTDTTRVNYSDRITQTDGTAAGTSYYSEDNFTNAIGALTDSMIIRDYSDIFWSDGIPGNEVKIDGISIFPDTKEYAKNFVRFGSTRAIVRGDKIYAINETDRTKEVLIDDSGSVSDAWFFTPLNGSMAFLKQQADDSFHQNATELYSTDGTAAGTMQILQTENFDGHIDSVMISGGHGYFLMCDEVGANKDGAFKLWKSDGTVGGTVEIPGSPEFHFVKSVGSNSSHVLFTSTEFDSRKIWLWSYDVVASTFTRLHELQFTGEAITHQDVVFFTGYDAEHGSELWRSDGTVSGTRITGDLNPGIASSGPRDLTSVGNILLFSAAKNSVGCEPFAIDDVNGAPWLVQDINPGTDSSTPRRFTFTPGLNAVFFFADNGTSGQELWKLDMTGLQPYTAAQDWNLFQ